MSTHTSSLRGLLLWGVAAACFIHGAVASPLHEGRGTGEISGPILFRLATNNPGDARVLRPPTRPSELRQNVEEPEDGPDEIREEDEQVVESRDGTYEIPEIGEREVFGWVEWICLKPEQIQLKAKLDSGARTSSMNAQDLTEFERDGKRWVRFHIVHPDTEELLQLEKPVTRFLRIMQHNGDPQRRPVIEMEVKLGNIHQKAEFSLIDRSNFIYQILIGRNFLRGLGLIDSEETFLSGRPCDEA